MLPTSVFLTTPNGGIVQIVYSWTFGEMAITAALCVLIVVFSTNWLYDIVRQLWSVRKPA